MRNLICRTSPLFVVFVLSICTSLSVDAGMSCETARDLQHSSLENNTEFWEQFTALSSRGDVQDSDVRNLLRRHGIDDRRAEARSSPSRAAAAAPAPTAAPRYELGNRARRDLASLPPRLRRSLDEALAILNDGRAGLLRFRASPGRWNLKRNHGELAGMMSVRLDSGYRVVFEELADGTMRILDISNSATH